ncbi:hypothetical protein IE81DRAFT_48151 [Ceraceosorus guamensis]|uniref:Secreted protein n=1 Tax=Ceraceosorus guamensis TaxID=1522189 RepID=A0A316W8T7_9BASI|nr:hypothetical protein IE81DRAFT_48151 [Ceraceosorus guamensis]PWN44115.1 hypothetical protein IE81DRAFT_48151 [Ceraceosorus guamensis]
MRRRNQLYLVTLGLHLVHSVQTSSKMSAALQPQTVRQVTHLPRRQKANARSQSRAGRSRSERRQVFTPAKQHAVEEAVVAVVLQHVVEEAVIPLNATWVASDAEFARIKPGNSLASTV